MSGALYLGGVMTCSIKTEPTLQLPHAITVKVEPGDHGEGAVERLSVLKTLIFTLKCFPKLMLFVFVFLFLVVRRR